jgi:hypothetical protein
MKSRKEIEEKLKIIKGLLEYLRNTNMHKDENRLFFWCMLWNGF